MREVRRGLVSDPQERRSHESDVVVTGGDQDDLAGGIRVGQGSSGGGSGKTRSWTAAARCDQARPPHPPALGARAGGAGTRGLPGAVSEPLAADLAAIGAMVKAGWSDTRIAVAFARADWRIGERYRELRDGAGLDRAGDYLELTIHAARGARFDGVFGNPLTR